MKNKEKRNELNALKEQTLKWLLALRLSSMRDEYERMTGMPEFEPLSHDEWLHHLVSYEIDQRSYRRRERFLKDSGLSARDPSSLEKLTSCKERGINETLINGFKTCDWLKAPYVAPILISGATGTGKSFLAKALGKAAIGHDMAVYYTRLPQLLEMMHSYGQQNKMPTFRQRMSRYRLLIIDDWGMSAMNDQDRSDILSLFDERIGTAGLVIASQLDFSDWHEYIGEAYHADAIMDRLINGGHFISLKGESMRKRLCQTHQEDSEEPPDTEDANADE